MYQQALCALTAHHECCLPYPDCSRPACRRQAGEGTFVDLCIEADLAPRGGVSSILLCYLTAQRVHLHTFARAHLIPGNTCEPCHSLYTSCVSRTRHATHKRRQQSSCSLSGYSVKKIMRATVSTGHEIRSQSLITAVLQGIEHTFYFAANERGIRVDTRKTAPKTVILI